LQQFPVKKRAFSAEICMLTPRQVRVWTLRCVAHRDRPDVRRFGASPLAVGDDPQGDVVGERGGAELRYPAAVLQVLLAGDRPAGGVDPFQGVEYVGCVLARSTEPDVLEKKSMLLRAIGCLGLLIPQFTPLASCAADGSRAYDPLAIAPAGAPPTLDLTINDGGRGREIPLRVYLPAAKTPQPVVLFSHGLGGSREGSAFLGEHWAARGYVVVYLQHPGSDTTVWKDKPIGERMTAMRNAASAQNLLLRVKDVSFALDQLRQWNADPKHPLAGRLNLDRVGMSGHSFGAVTTQAVSGQALAGRLISFTDPRIKAAIAFSPSGPRAGMDPKKTFGDVKIPWMLMTGTNDVSAIGDIDVKSRLSVYPALPAGGKYELVLDRAEHSAFTDRPLPGDREKRNPNHHRAILALSTAFWDAQLRGDKAAQKWLDGEGPRQVLELNDRWQHK
jgi:predicted dienelactone hydrolase